MPQSVGPACEFGQRPLAVRMRLQPCHTPGGEIRCIIRFKGNPRRFVRLPCRNSRQGIRKSFNAIHLIHRHAHAVSAEEHLKPEGFGTFGIMHQQLIFSVQS